MSELTNMLLAKSESCVNLDKYGPPRKYVTVHSGSRVRRCYSVPTIPAKMRIAPSPNIVLKNTYVRSGPPRWRTPHWSRELTQNRDRYFYNTPFWPKYTGPTFHHDDSRYNLKNYYFPGTMYEPRFGWSALYYLDPAYYWRRGQHVSRDVEYDSYYDFKNPGTWASTYFPFGHTSSYRYYHDNAPLRHG